MSATPVTLPGNRVTKGVCGADLYWPGANDSEPDVAYLRAASAPSLFCSASRAFRSASAFAASPPPVLADGDCAVVRVLEARNELGLGPSPRLEVFFFFDSPFSLFFAIRPPMSK